MDKPEHNNFISALISLTPALIQIFAFFAIELSNRLNLKNLFINSDSLLFINFLTLITSLCFIALYSYWKSKSFILSTSNTQDSDLPNNPSQGNIGQKKNIPIFGMVEKMTYKYLRIGISISVASGLILLAIVSTKQIIPKNLYVFQVLFQWITYILLLSSFSLNMYIWLEDKNTRDRYQRDRDSLMSLILEKLRENGWLDELKIHFMSDGGGNKNLIINVNDKYLVVTTTFDGKQILFVKEFENSNAAFSYIFPPPPTT